MVSVAQLDSFRKDKKSLVDVLTESPEDKEIYERSFMGERYFSPLQARTKNKRPLVKRVPKKSAIKKISLRNIKSKKPKRKVKSK